MDIAPVGGSLVVTAVARQLQTTAEMQISIMKQLVESQQQISAMLQSVGIGSQVDVDA